MASPSEDIQARRERIVVLLENYVDVESGMRDRRGSGEPLPLMCRAWRVPRQGYPELDHQLNEMRNQAPTLYWHLAHTYFYAPRRRVLQCQRCKAVMPSWQKTTHFHKHGHSNVAVVPRVVRVTHPSVQTKSVDEAVDWLERSWRGAGFIPDELKVIDDKKAKVA